MYAITFLQPAYGRANGRDLANCGSRESLFDKDQVLGIRHVARIERVGCIARLVLDEIIFGIKAGLLDDLARAGDKFVSIGFGHIDIEGFEEVAIEKSSGQIGEHRVERMLPSLYREQNVSVVEGEQIGEFQLF